ncbi:hypothetical protein [Streptacidiphilus sp. EB129]|uniref:hypothetical protein n=1 Tax=Streptacidiphilus sp. EB129 TaxID=3156262 RepID=UPI0035126256
MTIKNLPLNAGKLGAALCVSLEIKTEFGTGEAKADKDGLIVWAVGVAVRPEGSTKAAIIEVAVSGEPVGLGIGQFVQFTNLEAFLWEINGRTGLSFRADSIHPAPAPTPTPSAAPPAPAAAPSVGKGAAK